MIVIYFLLGIILASFINATAYRFRMNFDIKDFAVKPSHCENCGKRLRWFDLVPVISYLITKGRCSQCRSKIYWYYPISELYLGIVYASLFYFGFGWEYYVSVLFIFFLSYWDIKDRSIPKVVTDALFILSLIFASVSVLGYFEWRDVYRFILPFLLLGLWWIVNLGKEKMGWGDLIIFTSIILAHGVLFGLSVVFFTILAGGLFGILLVVKAKENRKKYIPLVPFILIGYLLSIILIEDVARYLFVSL